MNPRQEAILSHPALIPVTGNYDRKPRSLDRDVTTLGRARGSDLCLEANEISTLHCILYRTMDGFRIRDCNSRTGTRVNGESIKNHALRDGDIINLGPFSFELRIPPALFPKDGPKLDAFRVAHWMQSRRRLAMHALKLRERLRSNQHGTSVRETELAQKAHWLKEKIRSYDVRTNELEEAERELTEERDKLAQERESHLEHVRQMERKLASQLTDADEEIHLRWQEFQQRCQAEEARLRNLEESAPAAQVGEPAAGGGKPAHELQEEKKRLHEVEERLTRQQQQLKTERQEFMNMKEQWVKEQTHSSGSVDEQKAALAEQEAAVRAQKAELGRMMADLKKMQEDLRKQSKADLRSLQVELERLQRDNAELHEQLQEQANLAEVRAIVEENARLQGLLDEVQGVGDPAAGAADSEHTHRQLDELREHITQLNRELDDRDARIEELQAAPKPHSGVVRVDKDAQQFRAENELLKKLLQEKEQFVADMNKKSQQGPKTENDLEQYETELNEYRRQIDEDRTKLNQEVEMLRERNKELDEAVREMEMSMSKERADLGRERIRLERVRDEIKADMERLQREIAVRDSMAPVQKLRDEITGKQPPGQGKGDKQLNDRLKTLRQVTESSS